MAGQNASGHVSHTCPSLNAPLLHAVHNGPVEVELHAPPETQLGQTTLQSTDEFRDVLPDGQAFGAVDPSGQKLPPGH